MNPNESVEEQRATAQFAEPGDVWTRMASILVSANGHRILRPTLRGQMEDGLALVIWTEAHFMSIEEYDALVTQAREQASEAR